MMSRRTQRPKQDAIDSAFDSFLAQHLEGLARYARLLTRNRDDAHDLLAECLVKAQSHWQNIAQMSQPLAYIRKMLLNTVISERRSWNYRHIYLTNTGNLPETTSDDCCGTIERLEELGHLLRLLTHRQRTMVVLSYYLDLSDRQIAEELGCTPGTVRATISRALDTLRAEAEGPDPIKPKASMRSRREKQQAASIIFA